MENLTTFKNKTILVTGGTGSFGQKFIEIALSKYKPKKIIVYSRDELKQFDMEKKFAKYNNIRFFIGDVRDLSRLKKAMENVDYVVHAAALKQVPTIEYNPFEAVKTNIIGAQNVIDAAISNNVKKIIALSTDKAAAPVNLYGATKLASDKLFISANNFVGKKNIKFSVVRYGNVMGSRGSVIPFFLECKKKGVIPITDNKMTRFNITLEEGVQFVIKCFSMMIGGELFVPKIPSFKILDLAKAIAPGIKTKLIGIRPGEKIHEEMITKSDSLFTFEFKKYFVIIPNNNFRSFNNKDLKKIFKKRGGKLSKKEFSYNSMSNSEFLSIEKLRLYVKKIIIK
jgi:UDP-N-acetylglucosamine 4,6-dehydratase/5-epimerase